MKNIQEKLQSWIREHRVLYDGFSVLVLLIISLILLRWLFGNNIGMSGFTDGPAMLVFITAMAVAIERSIELIWTIVGSKDKLGAWWPAKEFFNQIDSFMENLDDELEPVFSEVKEAAQLLKDETETVNVEKDIDNLKKRIQAFRDLAPGNQQVNLVSSTALLGLEQLTKKYGGAYQHLGGAQQFVGCMADLAASFQSNPGRRLVSIILGACFGMIVSLFFGLDMFLATGNTPAATVGGMLLTGLVIGLGANPTHELIKVLQLSKQSRELDNGPSVESDTRQIVAVKEGEQPQKESDKKPTGEDDAAQAAFGQTDTDDDLQKQWQVPRSSSRPARLILARQSRMLASDPASGQIEVMSIESSSDSADQTSIRILELPGSTVSTFSLRRRR